MQTSSPDSASPEHLQKMRCLVEEANAAAQRRLWAGSGLALALALVKLAASVFRWK